jgi:hypothetical protein
MMGFFENTRLPAATSWIQAIVKTKTAVQTAVNGAISWWLAEIHNTNGTQYFRRIRANGGKSRPVKLGALKWVKWEDRGDKLNRQQFQQIAEMEWEIKQARAAVAKARKETAL